MGLFSKKDKVERCPMCDAALTSEDKYSHEFSHIAQIGPTEPAWLPEGLRIQAQGEYTFRCERCNSYPDQKWPSNGGAGSAMKIHLGVDHNVGQFAGNYGMRSAINFNMVPIR